MSMCPPSATIWEAKGSGSHAPSSRPAANRVSVVALAVGSMVTSPPPVTAVRKPFCLRKYRSATSWVLASCGVASVFPPSWATDVMEGLTMSSAPPVVAPAMIRSACPWLLTYPLTAGAGPTYAASIAPVSRAEISSGPAVKTSVASLVEPSARWK
jgi:hypothetical protein